MTGADAFAEIAVRPLVFGDATLIEAIRIAGMVEECRERARSKTCRGCGRSWQDMDKQALVHHLNVLVKELPWC
jgi:hypothetical protein